jgi:hypothetical protein
MAQEAASTTEVTKWVVQILDANNEKADLQTVVDATGPHLILQDKNKLLELLKKLRNCLMGC